MWLMMLTMMMTTILVAHPPTAPPKKRRTEAAPQLVPDPTYAVVAGNRYLILLKGIGLNNEALQVYVRELRDGLSSIDAEAMISWATEDQFQWLVDRGWANHMGNMGTMITEDSYSAIIARISPNP